MALSKEAIGRLRAPINKDLIKVRPIPGGGKSTYISHQTYTRILNEGLEFQKSWTILEHWKDTLIRFVSAGPNAPKQPKEVPVVFVRGALLLDEGHIHIESIGCAEFTDENAYEKASTDAFRKACKRLGIGQDTWKEGREELYEDDEEEEGNRQKAESQQTRSTTQPPSPADSQTPPAHPTPHVQLPQFSQAQIARMKDIKEAFNIPQGMSSLDPFIKKWQPGYTWQNLNADNIDAFMDFIDENPQLYADM